MHGVDEKAMSACAGCFEMTSRLPTQTWITSYTQTPGLASRQLSL